MRDLVVGRCEFGPTHAVIHPRSTPPKSWSEPPPRPPGIVRDALIQARAALKTAAADTPEDLAKPERASTIERKIEAINEALSILDDAGL